MTTPDANTSSSTIHTTSSVTTINITKLEREHGGITKLKEPLDNTNWAIWQEQIHWIFKLCRVGPYIDGTLPCPDPAMSDQDSLDVWDCNDVYAQILITNNISGNQMVHVS